MLSQLTLHFGILIIWLTNFKVLGAGGIHCLGGSTCNPVARNLNVTYYPQSFQDLLLHGNQGPALPGGPVHSTHRFQRNENIACAREEGLGGICLRLEGQNIAKEGILASTIIDRLQALIEHGCDICGGVPIDSTRNDISIAGQLAIRLVRPDPHCSGVCRQPPASALTR